MRSNGAADFRGPPIWANIYWRPHDCEWHFIAKMMYDHGKKKLFAYEAADEPISDPAEEFRIGFFNVLLQSSVSFEECFSQLKQLQDNSLDS